MADDPQDLACPVCTSPAQCFVVAEHRSYFRCHCCGARFMAPQHYLDARAERAYYALHENDVQDQRYRRFLSKLADPLLGRLQPGAQGLDYGCGPGPALADMMQSAGHPMALYDPFFAPDPAPLARHYDFVTCTEVAEHFHHPIAEFARLRDLVKPGGWLAVMTCFQTDDARFAAWQYRADPTHVVFYREITFRYLAQAWGWRCEVPVKDVALLQRPLG